MQCQEIIACLERLSPPQYACDWDNIGLLVGRKEKEIKKILIGLDATMELVNYGIEQQVDMLITHHPMLFSPVKAVNQAQPVTEKVLKLAEAGISYYAMHTNFDAVGGMAELAAGPGYLNLTETQPIEYCPDSKEGMGRIGKLPQPMTTSQVAEYVKERFGLSFVLLYQRPQDREQVFDRIAVMPGSGKHAMQLVLEQGCSLYLTGDYGHHEGLDAMELGMTVMDATHYGLEHIFISFLADYLREQLGTEVELLQADFGCPVQLR
jgi:dinuclear metal center YbgI/SA1388 family protein